MARPKGSKNKKISTKRQISETAAETLANLDRAGRSMAQIQIDAARHLETLAEAEKAKKRPNRDEVLKFSAAASKIAHDVSPYLYATLQKIKHGGDEDAPAIRMESLSEYQLEVLIGRLRKG